MPSENEIIETALSLVEKKKELEVVTEARYQLLLKIRSLQARINLDETELIQYLADNDLKRIYVDDYSFLAIRKAFPEIKILKDANCFPDKYKLPPVINKVKIIETYHRKEIDQLEGLVKINPDKKYIKIEKIQDATITYSNPKKKAKRLSRKSSQ
jgi:hypothetical protein